MQAAGSGELFLAYQAMLVHVLRVNNESLTVNGFNILAFEDGIDWDITRIKGGAAGVLARGALQRAPERHGLRRAALGR